MPEGRLERTRRAYEHRWISVFRSQDERLHVWDSSTLRREGLPPGEEEYRDGVLVRRGEIVEK